MDQLKEHAEGRRWPGVCSSLLVAAGMVKPGVAKNRMEQGRVRARRWMRRFLRWARTACQVPKVQRLPDIAENGAVVIVGVVA